MNLLVTVVCEWLSSVQATFSKSRSDDARPQSIPAGAEETSVDARTPGAGAHSTDVGFGQSRRAKLSERPLGRHSSAQILQQNQDVPPELSAGDGEDERTFNPRDQQESEV